MGRLLGLTGLAGCGKDTAAVALVADGWVRDAFADRMRVAMLALDPIVSYSSQTQGGHERGWRLGELVEAHGWDVAKRDYREVRRLLQRFGTEAGRDIHGADCWVDLVLDPWRRAAEQPDLVVTDVRFENEARAIREAGGTIVQVWRPGLEPLAGGHSSEAGFPRDLISTVVFNDGTVEELQWQILEIAGLI